MSFLPTEYTKIPTNSDYMKLTDGQNTFRVLSSAVVGYKYWTIQNKPVRSRERWDSIPDDMKPEKDGTYKFDHFWAFVVWNYDETRVQILELTQVTIQGAMKAYVDNARWGDPKMYDITVTKSGAMFDTKYQTVANPPIGAPEQKIVDAYAKKPVNLDALFDTDGDPFMPSGGGTGTSQPAPAEAAPEAAQPMSAEEEAAFKSAGPNSIPV
jgi:hypothetical protein